MHQSMLNPRVGGAGIHRAFDCISFPTSGNNERFDVTRSWGWGNLTRFYKSLEPSLSLVSQSSLGLLFQEVAWRPFVSIACSLLNMRGSQVECDFALVINISISVWYLELPSNDVATKLQLTSFSLTLCLFPGNTLLKKRLSLIVRVNVVLNRTVVVDSDWRFDNLCGSHLQSQSELYHVSWWYYTF